MFLYLTTCSQLLMTKKNVSGKFWAQKLYRGDDPLSIINKSQLNMKLLKISLNEKTLNIEKGKF
jgi:hypothetical protein